MLLDPAAHGGLPREVLGPLADGRVVEVGQHASGEPEQREALRDRDGPDELTEGRSGEARRQLGREILREALPGLPREPELGSERLHGLSVFEDAQAGLASHGLRGQLDELAAEAHPRQPMCLQAHRLAWMRFRGELVELPTESMAREARLRVLEDGEPMESLAAELRLPWQSWEGFAEDLPPELAPCLSGAPLGQLVGPVPVAEGFTLFRLAARVLPDLDDPSVRQRAEDFAWQATVRSWIEEHVRWEIHV